MCVLNKLFFEANPEAQREREISLSNLFRLIRLVVLLTIVLLSGCRKQMTNLDLICEGIEKEKAFVQLSNQPALERTEEAKKAIQFHFKQKKLQLEDDSLIDCPRWSDRSLECEDDRTDSKSSSNHFYLKFEISTGRVLSTSKMYSKNENIERKSETRFVGVCTALKV